MAELRGNAGSSIEQNHSLKKAMGEARYLDDLEIPRLVYGAILRSPHALCTVLSIDVSQAAQVDGQWVVTKAIMSRSARIIMEGWVRVPGDTF